MQKPFLKKQRDEWLILHGPTQAIAVANNEPKSWPRVAPAPINPNSLEPDWIQDGVKT